MFDKCNGDAAYHRFRMQATPASTTVSVKPRRSVRVILGILLFFAAFAPRATSLDTAFMIDESLWLDRSERFIGAMANGSPGAAFATGHPGVTTMWITGISQATIADDAPLRERYARARLALAIVASLLIVALWLISVPLLGGLAAGIGALLVAFDPFLLAHTRVVHLDGMHALTTAISFVALLRARAGHSRMLATSAVFAGLAMLTKTLPSAPLILAAIWLLRRDGRKRILAWFGIAAGVFALGWPLVWVRPWKAAWLLGWGAARAAVDDVSGTRYFFGKAITPGPLYYPVVIALRSSITSLGAMIFAAIWAVRRRRIDPRAATAFALLVFALGAVAFLTVSGKKTDRYALPSLLVLDLAAAAGIAWLIGRMRVRSRGLRAATTSVAIAALLLVHAAPALALHPFEVAHYNWAAGGPRAARRAITIGHGEGLETAAADMSRLAPGKLIAASRTTHFAEFYNGHVVRIDDPAATEADFVLFYISTIQSLRYAQTYRLYRDVEPFYRLRINQLDYVIVWRAQS